MKLLLENWRKYMNEEVERVGDYTIITRRDGKIVLSSKEVFDHIGTHGDYGVGSVFSGAITPEMIIDFIENRANLSDAGGFVSGDFPGGGYELVKPMSWVRENIPDAQFTTTKKQEFNREAGKMVDVPVLAVKTNMPVQEFATSETSVGIFKYDPSRSSSEQNNFIDSNQKLSAAASEERLYALATAFPGGFEIEGLPVPRVTEWGGDDPESAQWAVIIPMG
jgi:hypothetical protein